ncbi:hypothetical protein QFC20_006031 [Naganishia adeliensis]|uniref:Uncharacterized protein n=1 Tax=Naganishia adeliensis TaxID=92952 RepID=A0ACC2VG22_9TREE|nr:hypothetical protein QFC20_006031 [Naganishia adeliensis]
MAETAMIASNADSRVIAQNELRTARRLLEGMARRSIGRTARMRTEKGRHSIERTGPLTNGGKYLISRTSRLMEKEQYKGEAKAFKSDKGSYDRSHVPRSHETSKGYTRNDRPYGQFRRGNEEGGEADPATSKKPVELEKRLRIRPGTSPYDASVHLNNYIRNSRNPKTHGSNETAGADYLETAEEILKTAPKESVNVAVWNVLLSGFAKERKYQRMFKAFNDMKKRGIRPSSRTYAIMLDNYPSSFDSPAKTLSRATLLYDQAQEHVQDVLDKIAEAKESEGYELSSDRPSKRIQPDEDAEESKEEKAHLSIDAYTSGNAIAPTNAYLAQMSHFSRFDEVKRVFEAMPKDGPRAPDGKTYTILFEANMAFAAKQRSSEVSPEVITEESGKSSTAPSKDTQETLFDPIALWKEIVDRDTLIRQKIGKGSGQAKPAGRTGPRLMDEQQAPLLDDRLVITALRCFMSGPMEQRTFALDEIVPSIYNLSAPGRSTYFTAFTPSNSARFEISERAVETILKLCLAAGRAREGVHYAEQILNMPKAFTDQLSLTHYNAILALYSKAE